MSTLVRLVRSRDQLPFDESPGVAVKVLSARLALFGVCVLVVGGGVIVVGAVPGALDFAFAAALLAQAVTIGVLLRERWLRERRRPIVDLRDPMFTFGAPMTTAAEGEVGRQARERLLARLDQLDERELRLLALSLLAETTDGVD